MQYEQVKELIQIFEQTDLSDMEVKLGDATVKLSRSGGKGISTEPSFSRLPEGVTLSPVASSPKEEAEEQSSVPEVAAAESGKAVTAPIVGTFYQASAPDKPPFVKVGDAIAKGDVVCIIEAMKFMNEVTSEIDGVITDILVEDGQFVEFGQELFRVK